MFKDAYLFGVADADIFIGDQLAVQTKTLIDSGISIGVSSEDIRAGKGAMLIGKPTHSGTFELNMTDALFSMEYFAMNTGSDVEIGGDAVTLETVTVTEVGKLQVKGEPSNFNKYGKIGWYRKQGEKVFMQGTFTENKLTVSGALMGEVYEVKYVKVDDALKQIVVSANILPKEVHVVLHSDLYAGEEVESSDIIGEVQIDVPRFKLAGNQDLAMSMTGACNTNLSGSALAQNGHYATIKDIRTDATWYDALLALGMENEAQIGEKLQVYGIFANAMSKVIKPSLLTFTGATTDGVVNGTANEYVTVKVKGESLPTRIAGIVATAKIVEA